jgi:acyl carrier protein
LQSRIAEKVDDVMSQNQSKADEIRTEVIKLVAEITERSPEEISDTALFIEDLGIDSLMAIEMLVAMDKKYKIHIPEEEFGKIKNVKDAVAMVLQHVPA